MSQHLDGTADTVIFPRPLGVQPSVHAGEDGNKSPAFDGIYADAFAFHDRLTDDQPTPPNCGDRLWVRDPDPEPG